MALSLAHVVSRRHLDAGPVIADVTPGRYFYNLFDPVTHVIIAMAICHLEQLRLVVDQIISEDADLRYPQPARD